MAKREHMPVQQEVAKKTVGSAFGQYVATAVGCVLVTATGFTFTMFSTDTINVPTNNTIANSQEIDVPRTYSVSIRDIERERDKTNLSEVGEDSDESQTPPIIGIDPDEYTDPDENNQPAPVDPSTYAGKIINEMRAKGYNDYAIAGALGSFVAESGLNPSTTQGHACDGADNATVRSWQGGRNGRAIGFAQWDGSRATGLLNAADAAGVPWNDFDFQLNYYMAELGRQGYGVSDANSNCTDVEHAAWYFTKKFERCGTCKYAPCGGSVNNQHGVGDNAVDVSFENRSHMNGFNTRSSEAQNFYNTYF